MAQEKQIVSATHVWLTVLLLVSIIAGVASVLVNASYIIFGIFLIINVVFIIKYPMWGLLVYLVIFMLRPGEMYPILAPLRVELLTGLLVMVTVVLHQRHHKGKVTFPADNITLSILAFLAAMCITVFVSYEKSLTFGEVQEFIKLLVFYYLIISIIDTKKKFVAFVTVYLLAIGYISFDAFKLYLAGGFVHTMGVDRLQGTTSAGGDPNSLANTLASTIPFVVASVFYFKRVPVKVVLSILAVFMAALITVTASRGGMVAFAAVIMGAIAFSRHKAAAIAAVIIFALAGWTVLPDQYKDRYRTLTDVEDIDQTSSGRWAIWESGVNMIITRPILGVGAGAFFIANGSGDFGPPRYMQAHNLYIQLLATTGVVGGLCWFAFIYNFIGRLQRLRRKISQSGRYRWIRIYSTSFLISLIALFISGMFAHSLYRYTWYVLAALTTVMWRLAVEEAPDEESRPADESSGQTIGVKAQSP